MNKLIIDCGATTCLYNYVDSNQVITSLRTSGYSPIANKPSEFPQFQAVENPPDVIYYFGTAVSEENKINIGHMLKRQFPHSKISVNSDLLAAALSTCANRPGYVHIIGTGSAVNFWDGKNFKNQKVNLGYLWEDYASGYDLSKTIISFWNEGKLSQEDENILESKFDGIKSLVKEVYSSHNPKLFLAKASPIIDRLSQNTHEIIINQQLELYFKKNIDIFAPSFQHHFIGSIAFKYQKQIKKKLKERKLESGMFLKDTIEPLTEYIVSNY